MQNIFHRIPSMEVYQKITIYLSQAISAIANMDVMNEIIDSVYAEDVIPHVSDIITPVIAEKINDFIAISLL